MIKRKKISFFLLSSIVIFYSSCSGNIVPYSGFLNINIINTGNTGKEFNDVYLKQNTVKIVKSELKDFLYPAINIPSKNITSFVINNKEIGLGFNQITSDKLSIKSVISDFNSDNGDGLKINKEINTHICTIKGDNVKDLRKDFSDIPIDDQGSRTICVPLSVSSLIDFSNKKASSYDYSNRASAQFLSWLAQESIYGYPVEDSASVINPQSSAAKDKISEIVPITSVIKLVSENSDEKDNTFEDIIETSLFYPNKQKQIYSNKGTVHQKDIVYSDSKNDILFKNTNSFDNIRKLGSNKSNPYDRSKALLGEDMAIKLKSDSINISKVRSFPVKTTLENLKNFISQGFPIEIGIKATVGNNGNKWRTSTNCIENKLAEVIRQAPEDLNNENNGGHALLLVGYIDVPNNKDIIFTENELNLKGDSDTIKDVDTIRINNDAQEVLKSWKTPIKKMPIDLKYKDILVDKGLYDKNGDPLPEAQGFFLVRNTWGKETPFNFPALTSCGPFLGGKVSISSHLNGYALIPYQWVIATGSQAFYMLPPLNKEVKTKFDYLFNEQPNKIIPNKTDSNPVVNPVINSKGFYFPVNKLKINSFLDKILLVSKGYRLLKRNFLDIVISNSDGKNKKIVTSKFEEGLNTAPNPIFFNNGEKICYDCSFFDSTLCFIDINKSDYIEKLSFSSFSNFKLSPNNEKLIIFDYSSLNMFDTYNLGKNTSYQSEYQNSNNKVNNLIIKWFKEDIVKRYQNEGDYYTWSPDSSKIVFQTKEFNGYETIATIDSDGKNKNILFKENDVNSFGKMNIYLNPIFSPDGERLLFISNRNLKDLQVFSSKIDGSNVIQVSDNKPGYKSNISWSPDGTKILYIRLYENKYELNIVDLFTGKNSVIIERDYYFNAIWSPDGSKIGMTFNFPPAVTVFDNYGSTAIYTINADGSNLLKITEETDKVIFFLKDWK